MHRHVNRAGQLHREIGDDPFITVLGDLRDAVARLDAGGSNIGRELRRLVEYLAPSAPVDLAPTDEAKCLLATTASHGIHEKCGNSLS